MNDEERLALAVSRTQVLRYPRQALATFGVTNIHYYILTRPAYVEGEEADTVVRMGRVIAERPHIVTPYYLSRLEGFSSQARRYFDKLIETHGADSPGIFYTYRNEPGSTDIMSNSMQDVLDKINSEIDAKKDPLAAVIQGEDTLWDVSLMKFHLRDDIRLAGQQSGRPACARVAGDGGGRAGRGPRRHRGHVPAPEAGQHRTQRLAGRTGALGAVRGIPGPLPGRVQTLDILRMIILAYRDANQSSG